MSGYTYNITPVAATSDIVRYEVKPQLPTGLSFDTTAGVISGIPTQTTKRQTYQMTAYNKSSATSVSFDLEVNTTGGDFDVGQDGAMITALGGTSTIATCVAASGEKYTKILDNREAVGVHVNRDPMGELSIVTARIYKVGNLSSSRTYFSWLVNKKCEVRAGPIENFGAYEYLAQSINNNQVVILSYLTNNLRVPSLSFYNSNLELVSKQQISIDSSIGIHLAVNANTGNGVATMESNRGPVQFVRFNMNGTVFDSSPFVLSDTTGNGSWYDSHTVGIDQADNFVILWTSYNQNARYAYFYDWNKSLLNTRLVLQSNEYTYEGFRSQSDKFLIQHDGTYFYIPSDLATSGAKTTGYQTFDSTGVLRNSYPTANGAGVDTRTLIYRSGIGFFGRSISNDLITSVNLAN